MAGAGDPPRLTGRAWFRREHRKVPEAAWRDARVKSAANCAACHTRAEEGSFREREILPACRGDEMKKILVWDLPVRLGHWLMVGGFALAWATGDSEKWRLVHVFAGSTVMAVAAYRLLWGVVGSRTARFAEFVRGPGQAVAYLKSLLQARRRTMPATTRPPDWPSCCCSAWRWRAAPAAG
jgi:hypothetical protein